MLDYQPPRVFARSSRVPAKRALARGPRDRVDGGRDVLALGGLVHAVIVDPAPAVARDLVAAFDHGARDLGLRCERHARPRRR